MLILRDLMSQPVISIASNASVEDAAKLMAEKDISCLLIKEGENYIGIFTESDLVKRVVAQGLNPKTTAVSSVMSHPILTIDFCLTPEEATQKMLKHHVKRLAVTEGNKIVGIISSSDIVTI